MYSIFADNTAFEGGTNVCIYNDVTPLKTCKLINPKLVMEDSAAGSLEFVLPPGNAGYDLINPMTTDLVVYRDDEDVEIWRGRALSIDIDFYKRKRIYCEGELAFLNDTIQPPAKYSASAGTTVSSFLEALINIHNQNVSDNRKFQVGIVTVTDGDTTTSENVIYRYTNYESTLKCVNEKLVERLGGHLRIRHQNGVRLLDYLKDDDPVLDLAADQIIQFGKNLLDYTQNFTMDELATVIVPRGARLETETIEGLEDYLTVKSVNQGSIYVESEEAVNTYGRIIAVVDWDNVTDANNLLNKARQYLAKEQFDKMSLEITMIDLHYLNPAIKSLNLLNKVRCISLPHGMDNTFQVTKMSIDLANPDNSTYVLGTETKKNLTSVTTKVNSDLANSINNLPSENEILNRAKRDAFAILQGEEGGYVSFIKNANDQLIAIQITDNIKESESLSKWYWNNNGLAHYHRSTYQEEWSQTSLKSAITMDGKIVADFITAGTMSCDRLNGGTIDGQTINAGTLTGKSVFELYASLSNYDTTLNWGKTWGDSLTVVVNQNTEAGLGVAHKSNRYTKAVYIHYNDIRRYYDNPNPEYAQWGSQETSDIRLKKNIKTVNKGVIERLFRKLRFISFNYKNEKDSKTEYGMIAQDVDSLISELGFEHDTFIRKDSEGYLGLKYSNFSRLGLIAIQDIYEKIDNLQNQINTLKGERNG